MARVMIIGYGPLPEPGLEMFNAATLRTRQILHGVRDSGHEFECYILPLHGTAAPESVESSLIEDNYENLPYQRFTTHSGEFAVRALNEEIQRIEPRAIVGIGSYPSYIASMLSTTLPLWCDLNGFWMAEIQAKCAASDDDCHLESAWNIERAILRRLDRFSAVSRPHLHAVLGELATVGRLNKYTFEYAFGSMIANSYHQWNGSARENSEKVLRGPVIPENAFIVLWSGGFKLWSDIDMLLQAMHELMGRHSEVHFVSTGAALGTVDQQIYRQFADAVAASPYRERFHLLGWLDSERLQQVYREADLGLNLDAPNYETMFGGRNRLNAMAIAGLPILTTLGTEMSEWLDDARAALVIPMRDSQALLDAVEPMLNHREKLKEYGRRARILMEEDFNETATTRPLCNWLANPTNAPDNQAKIKLGGSHLIYLNSIQLNSIEQQLNPIESPRTANSEPQSPQAEQAGPRKPNSLGAKLRKFLGSSHK